MFFPTLVGMLFNSILNLCDGMFVGHGVGSDALAAINIVAPLFLTCTGIGLMFGIGASVICGIRLAENNEKSARIIATQAIIAGAIIFLIVIALCLLFTRQILYMLGCSPALESYARDYILWILPGLLFLYLQCAGMMLIRQDGAPKYAMAIQIVAAMLNIFLDWLMVFPLGWGLKGAAIATSISCIIGGLMVLGYLVFAAQKLKFYPLKWTGKALRLGLRNIGYMARVGLATFIAEAAMGIMMVTGNYMFMDYLGEAGVAAFSIGCYLFPLIFSINNAVAQSAQPIISFNYGAGDAARVRQTQGVAADCLHLRRHHLRGDVGGSTAAHRHLSQPRRAGVFSCGERDSHSRQLRHIFRSEYHLYRLLSELRTGRAVDFLHAAARGYFHCTVVYSITRAVRCHGLMAGDSGV